jgi:hypothetical protein
MPTTFQSGNLKRSELERKDKLQWLFGTSCSKFCKAVMNEPWIPYKMDTFMGNYVNIGF